MKYPMIIAVAAAMAAIDGAAAQTALGTGFTYQGRLLTSGAPASGLHDLRVRLFTAVSGGGQVGPQVCLDNINVSEGVFAVALDFGAQFNGEQRFLEVEVRADTGLGCGHAAGFVVLAPRQALSGSPYALGVRLPLAEVVDSTSSAIDIRNTGTGRVAYFQISNASNAAPALTCTTNGTGPALLAEGTVVSTRDIHARSPNQADASVFLGWGTDATGADVARLRISGNPPDASNGLVIQRPGDATLMRITHSGSVGIGVDPPQEKLHVAGSARVDGDIRAVNPNDPSSEVFLGWGVDENGADVARIRIGGGGPGATHGLDIQRRGNASLMRIHDNGNVGIGVSYSNVKVAISQGNGYALHAVNDGIYPALFVENSGSGIAGHFSGDVRIFGTLTKSAGSFCIDHPLDPANKYLSHSFVESPDMMNIYNGNVVTDERGYATVTMPDWFEALNRDFRYQLTVIGQFAQAIVAEEMRDGAFVICTDQPGVKVSWQITGIRQDAWAEAHRIPVEHDKPAGERGRYMCPELHGQPAELRIRDAHPSPNKREPNAATPTTSHQENGS